jgi:prevent-host-death family protein
MQREATAMTVRQNLGELLNEVQYKHDSIIITKAGKPVAAMVDMATFERMRRQDSGEFERLWAQFAKGFEELSDEHAEQLAHEAVQEARAEIHKEQQANQHKATPSQP